MASAVYYRFRAQREPQKLTFDGHGISVWELKREIILQNKLGKGTDFDLAVYDADTEEEYKDDNTTIPRSSHVTVRRLPPSKPGRGTAQNYVADLQAAPGAPAAAEPAPGPSSMYRGPMTRRFDAPSAEPGMPSAPVVPASAVSEHPDEASKIAAMFLASSEQWEETQERMSQYVGMPRRGGGRGGYSHAAPPAADRPPPPPGFICYRCGQKGHWIQDCPTNDNPEYDHRRFKRTTGIPKSMLKTVEQASAGSMSGVMVAADGSYVVATPDSSSWQRSRARSRPLSKTDVYKTVPSDPSLACPLCTKLLRDAVITPCCHTTFCEECIQTHLFEHDFVCAECEKRIPDIEQLKIDDAKRKLVRDYIDKTIAQSEEALEQGTGVDEEAAHQAAISEFAAAGAVSEPAPAPAPAPAPTPTPTAPEAPEARAPPTDGAPAPADAGRAENSSAAPAAVPPVSAPPMQFQPQLVQQLVQRLQDPSLPVPTRVQLQMQLQMQQMLFFQSFGQGGPPGMPGMPGMPPGMPGMPPGMPGMPPGVPPAPAAEPPKRRRDGAAPYPAGKQPRHR